MWMQHFPPSVFLSYDAPYRIAILNLDVSVGDPLNRNGENDDDAFSGRTRGMLFPLQ